MLREVLGPGGLTVPSAFAGGGNLQICKRPCTYCHRLCSQAHPPASFHGIVAVLFCGNLPIVLHTSHHRSLT